MLKNLLFILTAIAILFMFSFSALAATTSTGYRYNNQYEKVSSKYSKLASFSSGGTFAIPGLENTNVSGENCDCMVPQGICVFKDYILITAYCGVEVYEDSLKSSLSSGDNAQKLNELKNHSSSGKPHNSVIYVLTKNSGKYVKTLVLSDDNHVGGIAYDGTYIWVAKSSDKQLSAILPSAVTSALTSSYESVVVEYYANVYCDCTASFVTTYNNMLWVGVFDKESSGTLCGYTLTGNTPETFELVAQKELVIPSKANGAALVDIGGETCLAVNSSYGRNNDTDVYLYSVDLQEDSNAANYTIYNKAILPPMAEDICIDNGIVYTLFESASTPYSCADGNKCKNIVDRVIKAPLEEWFYWTDGSYTETEPEIKNDENESPFSYEITNEADGRYVPNYIKTNDGVRMLYNPYSAEFALDLSVNAYKIGTDDSWYNTLSKHGYTQFKRIENGVAFTVGNKKDSEGNLFSILSGLNGAMGIKKLYYNGEIRYSIAVAFRGTNFKDIADVLTDISIVQSGGLHSGFSGAAEDFYNICKQASFVIDGKKITVAEIISDMQNEDSKYSMFITGHSLGAAVADVFAGEVLTKQQGVYPGNVVAYTFAAPLLASSFYSYNYHNIYNIVNTDDIVTCISLTGAKRLGYDIFYSPDDEFRKKYYGTNYSAGHDTEWWVTDINAINTGFVAHDSNKVYRAIITCEDEDIAKFAPYNTRTDNVWTQTNVTIDKYCFGRISGNLTTKSLIFENGSLEVLGDVYVEDGKSGTFKMKNENDYLLVYGNFTTSADSSYLSAGTIELKGDFSSLNYGDAYNADENHNTIFSGNKMQTISFDIPCESNKFQNLYLENQNVYFATPIQQLILQQDTELKNNSELSFDSYSGVLNLNGYSLKMNGNINAVNFYAYGGSAEITGDLNVGGTAILLATTCKVYGDFNLKGYLRFEKAYLEVFGDALVKGNGYTYTGTERKYGLYMANPDDYFLVHGNFKVNSASDYLTAGTIEVKGDFTVEKTAWDNGYYQSGDNHKTILSGDKKQTVYFGRNDSGALFTNLIIRNPDIYFASSIYQLVLCEDIEISKYNNLDIKGTLDLNGHALKMNGNVSAFEFNTNGGCLGLTGGINVSKKTTVTGQNSKIIGDFTSGTTENNNSSIEFEDNSLEIVGNMVVNYSTLYMSNNCYLLVCGDFLVSEYAESVLSNGTLEVKGDFTSKGNTWNYYERYPHKTILSGTEKQIVTFEYPGEQNRFQNLILQNISDDGVVFASDVYFAGPFKHNGCMFTLYNDGKNSVFLDSDYDGVLDPYDIFPTGAISITKLTISDIEDVIYNFSAIEPELVVKYNKINLTKDTHYTVKYQDNDKLGSAKAIITGLGEVEGSVEKSFNIVCSHKLESNIVKATLTKNGKTETKCSKCEEIISTEIIYYPKTVKLSSTSVTYNGKTRSPSVTVKDSKGNTLKKGADYEVKTPSVRKVPGVYEYKITFKGKYEGEKTLKFTILPKAPTVTDISATQSTSVIALKWAASAGATGYRVYQYSPSKGKYVQIASVKTTSYKKTGLKAGTEYKFKIKPYTKLSDGTVLWSTARDAFATATECKAPSIKTVTSSSKAKATVKWSSIDGETGYQLYYSTKKTSGFKKVDSYSANKLTGSKTFSSSSSGKTIYFKVRAYKKVNGQTIYSEWSAVKSVKLK